MNPPEPWVIQSNDRITAVGKTGSGKTAAVLKLVWSTLDSVAFLDIKGTEHQQKSLSYPVLTELDDVKRALFAEHPDDRLSKFVIAPERPDIDTFDELCRLFYERGNHHLIADELKTVYHGRGLTEHHNLILTNGRSKGVGFTGTTQRPLRIPREQLSESEHTFIFRLKDPDDADRVDSTTPGELPVPPVELKRYWYIYAHDELPEPKLCEPLSL